MFTITNDNIRIVNGDTAYIYLTLKDYTFILGDTVYFTVKKKIGDIEKILQKVITVFDQNGGCEIELTSTDTDIDVGVYYYDIQVNLLDGRVDTVIGPAEFRVIGGVTDE